MEEDAVSGAGHGGREVADAEFDRYGLDDGEDGGLHDYAGEGEEEAEEAGEGGGVHGGVAVLVASVMRGNARGSCWVPRKEGKVGGGKVVVGFQ